LAFFGSIFFFYFCATANFPYAFFFSEKSLGRTCVHLFYDVLAYFLVTCDLWPVTCKRNLPNLTSRIIFICQWHDHCLKSKTKEPPVKVFILIRYKRGINFYLLTTFHLNSLLCLETSIFWISELWWCVT